MPDVGCAVLAAGAGTRFGPPGAKLMARVSRKPLLQHAIDAACASDASSCTLIVGAAADRVVASVETRRVAVLVNVAWAGGLSTSIAAAVAAHAGDDACILMLGDQPGVRTQDLNALIVAHARYPRRIIALRRGKVWGAPVLFPASDFRALTALAGDAGAKRYAAGQAKRLSFVEASSEDAFADLDVPGDLRSLTAPKSRRTRRSRARR